MRTPYPENNAVHGQWFPAGPGSPRRAVIVLPHWNASAGQHNVLCKGLAKLGISALRISLPYHDYRMPAELERADYAVSANIGRTIDATRQAVVDVRSVGDWLEAEGYGRIGLIGTSLGSCIGFLTFVHEPRIRVGVYYHVSSYFGDVVWEGLTTAHVRRALETSLTHEDVRNAWLAISPNSYVSRLAGDTRPGLLISARYDLSFTPELSQLLFQECDRQGVELDRVIVPCGHYTLGRAPYKYYAGYLLVSNSLRSLRAVVQCA